MKAVVLTNKAIRELILALRCTRRSTEIQRVYIRKLIVKLEGEKIVKKGRRL